MSPKKVVLDPEELIFAMDIGTRSIVGIVGYFSEGKLNVLSTETASHPQRDMLDGQIHNIEGVFHTALKVKESLEKKLSISLHNVAIAAAGRALMSLRELAERQLDTEHPITPAVVSSLELEAVEKAQGKIHQETAPAQAANALYCVGFTTVAYYLDDYPIINPISQRGEKLGVEVLTTFLPQVVVDSLLTVVEKLGLSVQNLTLEPIAALNVTIPQEYRTLNLVLIDIGAGTSDIAITHKGTVVGYAMVPSAGDEVTEHIADHYLLDFNTAEQIKLKLANKKGKISFKDILGNNYNLPAEEIIKVIEPVVDQIAAQICTAIINMNNGPPRAVFCIGGGSQTTLLCPKIAEKLQLPPEMVVVRGREVIKNIHYTSKKLKGPEAITPLGIAFTAREKKYFGFIYVTVNGQVVRILDSEGLKVGNALIAAGFSSKKLLGKRGPSLKINFQGEEKIFKGTYGKNARIFVNDQESSLETEIKNNDRIEIIEALEGEPPQVKVHNLLAPDIYTVYLNGAPFTLTPDVYVNGKKTDVNYPLQDRDKVEIKSLGPIREFLKLAELPLDENKVLVNGESISLDHLLQPGDSIEVILDPQPKHTQGAISPGFEKGKTENKGEDEAPNNGIAPETTGSNEQPRDQEKANPPAGESEEMYPINQTHGAETKENSVIKITVNGEEISLKGEGPINFVDIFNHINFERDKPKGKLIMTHNGRPASLTGHLQDGDEVTIYWEN